MVRRLRAETDEKQGTIKRVADQLGCGTESLRTWVKQDEVDRGESAGVTTAEAERIKALEQESRELRRANATLKRASAFFAAELDYPLYRHPGTPIEHTVQNHTPWPNHRPDGAQGVRRGAGGHHARYGTRSGDPEGLIGGRSPGR